MEDLDPNVRFGWTSGRSWVNDGWRENDFSKDSADTFLALVRAWTLYRGDRDRLALAMRRLAALSSRGGRFETEDLILDAAIILKTTYSLDSSEITFELATHAGFFLGIGGNERMEIFRKVKDFHDARSALVYGPRGGRRGLTLERLSLMGGSLPKRL